MSDREGLFIPEGEDLDPWKPAENTDNVIRGTVVNNLQYTTEADSVQRRMDNPSDMQGVYDSSAPNMAEMFGYEHVGLSSPIASGAMTLEDAATTIDQSGRMLEQTTMALRPELQAEHFEFLSSLRDDELRAIMAISDNPEALADTLAELENAAAATSQRQADRADIQARVDRQTQQEIDRQSALQNIANFFATELTFGLSNLWDEKDPEPRITDEQRAEYEARAAWAQENPSETQRELKTLFGLGPDGEDFRDMDRNGQLAAVRDMAKAVEEAGMWEELAEIGANMAGFSVLEDRMDSPRLGTPQPSLISDNELANIANLLVDFQNRYESTFYAAYAEAVNDPSQTAQFFSELGDTWNEVKIMERALWQGKLPALIRASKAGTAREYAVQNGLVGRPAWTVTQEELDQEAEANATLAADQDELELLVARRASYDTADNMWEDLDEEIPGLKERYLTDAGGDEDVAFGFFTADIQDQIEEASSAEITELADGMRDGAQDMIVALEEKNFRPGASVLETLAWYGKEIPGFISTAGTLALARDDINSWDVFTSTVDRSNRLGLSHEELIAEVAMNDYRPSAVVGYEDTMTGLFLDLSTGIIADPLTWIFGPGGARSINNIKLVDDAMKHGVTIRHMDEITNLAISDDLARGLDDGIIEPLIMWMDEGQQSKIQLTLRQLGRRKDLSRAEMRDQFREVVEGATRRSMELLRTPDYASRITAMDTLGKTIRSIARAAGKEDPGVLVEMIDRLSRSRATLRRFSAEGPMAKQDIFEAVYMVWGDNPDALNKWLGRLREVWEDVHVANARHAHKTASIEGNIAAADEVIQMAEELGRRQIIGEWRVSRDAQTLGRQAVDAVRKQKYETLEQAVDDLLRGYEGPRFGDDATGANLKRRDVLDHARHHEINLQYEEKARLRAQGVTTETGPTYTSTIDDLEQTLENLRTTVGPEAANNLKAARARLAQFEGAPERRARIQRQLKALEKTDPEDLPAAAKKALEQKRLEEQLAQLDEIRPDKPAVEITPEELEEAAESAFPQQMIDDLEEEIVNLELELEVLDDMKRTGDPAFSANTRLNLRRKLKRRQNKLDDVQSQRAALLDAGPEKVDPDLATLEDLKKVVGERGNELAKTREQYKRLADEYQTRRGEVFERDTAALKKRIDEAEPDELTELGEEYRLLKKEQAKWEDSQIGDTGLFCVHGLPIGKCPICRKGKSDPYIAQQNGHCVACGHDIRRGERITYARYRKYSGKEGQNRPLGQELRRNMEEVDAPEPDVQYKERIYPVHEEHPTWGALEDYERGMARDPETLVDPAQSVSQRSQLAPEWKPVKAVPERPDLSPDNISRTVAKHDQNLGRRLSTARNQIKELQVAKAKLRAKGPVLNRGNRIQKVLDEMMDEWNREVLGKSKFWQGKGLVDEETGMVDWADANRVMLGSEKATDDIIRTARETERKLITEAQRKPLIRRREKLMKKREAGEELTTEELEFLEKTRMGVDEMVEGLGSIASSRQMTVELPISPFQAGLLEGTTNNAFLTQLGRNQFSANTRRMMHALNRAWMTSVVLSPRTGMVVSADELIRIFHHYGVEGFGRWAGRAAKRYGGGRKAAQRMLERDVPKYFQQAERSVYETSGLGWVDIKRGQMGFEDAVLRYNNMLLSDDGFRAYLRGREAFKEWLETDPTGQARATKGRMWDMSKETTPENYGMLREATADELYDQWDMVVNNIFFDRARKEGFFAEMLDEVKATAAKIDEAFTASGPDAAATIAARKVEIPQKMVDSWGSIRGVSRDPGAYQGGDFSAAVLRARDRGFNTLFQRPMDNRRGIIAELERHIETERLHQLVDSNPNLRKMSLYDAAQDLGYDIYAGSSAAEIKDFLIAEALKNNIIPLEYIEQLAERKAIDQIQNMLYTFNMASIGGRRMRAIAPFLGPWADMWGFWSRQLFSQPAYRGPVNKLVQNVGRKLNWSGNLPFNPRTAAFLSRTAHLDMDLERAGQNMPGPIGDVAAAGGVDFSPLLFLPTGGSNAISTMIPQLGPIPLALMDVYIDQMAGDDAMKYQELVGQIGEYFPYLYFASGDDVQDYALNRLWGGTIFQKGTALISGAGRLAGASWGEKLIGAGNLDTAFGGDLTVYTDQLRTVQAHMWENPDFFDDLMNAESFEDVEELRVQLLLDAQKAHAGGMMIETLGRALIPANADIETPMLGLWDAWTTIADENRDYFGEILSEMGYDTMPENLTRKEATDLAWEIRDEFFSMDEADQNRLIVNNPWLATQVVSTWTWTEEAIEDPTIDTSEAYRYNNTDVGAAEHTRMFRQGLIRQVPPTVYAEYVFDKVLSARRVLANSMLTTVAETINDQKWTGQVNWAETLFGAEFSQYFPGVAAPPESLSPDQRARAFYDITPGMLVKAGLAKNITHARSLIGRFDQYSKDFVPVSDETKRKLLDAYEQLVDAGLLSFPEQLSEDQRLRLMWESSAIWKPEHENLIYNMAASDLGVSEEFLREQWSSMITGIISDMVSIPVVERPAYSTNTLNYETGNEVWDLVNRDTLQTLLSINDDLVKDLEALGVDNYGSMAGSDFYDLARTSATLPGVGARSADGQYSGPSKTYSDHMEIFLQSLASLPDDEAAAVTQRGWEQLTAQDQILRSTVGLAQEGETLTLTGGQKHAFRQAWGQFAAANPDLYEWDQLWNDVYRGFYGDLNFEPPTLPTEIVNNRGEILFERAYRPTDIEIIDGDSFSVTHDLSFLERRQLSGLPEAGTRFEVRLVGVLAADYGKPGERDMALVDEQRLSNWLAEADAMRMPVTLVPATEVLTSIPNVDRYGRQLVILYRGNEPYTDGIDGWLPYNELVNPRE